MRYIKLILKKFKQPKWRIFCEKEFNQSKKNKTISVNLRKCKKHTH